MSESSDKMIVRKSKRTVFEPSDTGQLSAGERMAMVWPITVDAFTMTGNFDAESRLQRDVVCLKKRKR